MSSKLDTVSMQATALQTTAGQLKESRKKTWRSIAFVALVTALDVFATVFAYHAVSTVNTLITQVTCPTDALFLKTYNVARGATYPGGLPAYMHDMHTIYEQYTIVLHCSPDVTDPTAERR